MCVSSLTSSNTKSSATDVGVLAIHVKTENDTKCVRCGGDHNKNECKNDFSDTCSKNCGADHPASNLNCPVRLQFIKENPKLYVPLKQRKKSKPSNPPEK